MPARRTRLTVKGLDNPRPPKAGHVAHRYQETPGLEHRIYARQGQGHPQQTIDFGPYKVRGDRKSGRMRLGEWRIGDGATRLAGILARWRQAREDVRAGIDPKVRAKAEIEAAKSAEEKAAADTVDRLLDDWLELDVRARGLRTSARIERDLARLARPRLGNLSRYELRRGAIVTLCDEIAAKHGTRISDLILGYLGTAFSWAERRDENFRSPIIRGMKREKPSEHVRKRVLADDEIRDLFAGLALAPVPPRYADYVKALLYGARRRRELSHAQWQEVQEIDDVTALVVPPERSKNGDAIVMPLVPEMLALFGERKRTGYIFDGNGGEKPLNCNGVHKVRLDKAIAEIRERDGRPPMAHWTYHDLRRTGRTLLSRAGVAADIAERVLAHTIGGVRGVYDLHEYLHEKLDGHTKLAALIERILNPPAGNVASLDEVRAARLP
jgi:hypothetical protein